MFFLWFILLFENMCNPPSHFPTKMLFLWMKFTNMGWFLTVILQKGCFYEICFNWGQYLDDDILMKGRVGFSVEYRGSAKRPPPPSHIIVEIRCYSDLKIRDKTNSHSFLWMKFTNMGWFLTVILQIRLVSGRFNGGYKICCFYEWN